MAAYEEPPDTDIVHPRKRHSIWINRPSFNELQFQEIHEESTKEKTSLGTKISRFVGRQQCTSQSLKGFFRRVIPILDWLPAYDIKRDLMGDCAAGLTVGIMRLPQGMAYGLLATLAPVYGLYTVFFPAIIYAMMGTSRHISVGSFAVVSIMTAVAVDRVVEETRPKEGPYNEGLERAKIASSLAFLVGMIQFVLGALRLGFVSTYLAEPLVRGFTTGAAFYVFNSQFKYLFGIDVMRYSGPFAIIKTFIDLFSNLASTNLSELIIALVNLIALVSVKELQDKYKDKMKYPIPLELFSIVLTTLVSHFARLEERYGTNVVGKIPTGLPLPSLPVFSYMESMIMDAIVIAIVTFSVSVSVSYIFAKKNNYEIDANQELVALGSMSVVGSFFLCYPAATSLSRSLLQEISGGKTQLTSLFSCVFILIVLLFIAPLFYSLPKSCLAAIVVVALRGMFRQFKDIKVLWKYSKIDCMIWLVTWSSTALLGVDLGLAVGVVFAIMTVVVRTQKPDCSLMGKIPGTDIYRDVAYYKDAEPIQGIKIFRVHSPLYYANSDYVKSTLYGKSKLNPPEILRTRAKAETKRIKMETRAKKKEVRRRKKMSKHPKLDEEYEMTSNNTTIVNDHKKDLIEQLNQVENHNHHNDNGNVESIETTLEDGTHSLVLDLGSVSFIDCVGISALKSIIADYEKIGINVVIAHCKENVREMLLQSGFMKQVGLDRMFVTLHDAIQQISSDLEGHSVNKFAPEHISGAPGGDASYEMKDLCNLDKGADRDQLHVEMNE
ncbi:prestin-like [Asterias amurensis]|uniref:prestin-like n=1 Tax=Asterias amurensis TaxID=7602 RepID=UPI003AB1337C